MTPQIRLVPYDLVGEILALNRQTLEEHRARQPWAFASDMYESHMAPAILRSFQDENGNAQATSREICAAFDGGRFMGYVWFRGASHRGEWAEIAILDIAVLPEVRGQGTGRALVQNVIEMAKVMDSTNLIAHVWAGNEASARLFSSLGFSPQSQVFRFGPERQLPPLRTQEPAKGGDRQPARAVRRGIGHKEGLATLLVLVVLALLFGLAK